MKLSLILSQLEEEGGKVVFLTPNFFIIMWEVLNFMTKEVVKSKNHKRNDPTWRKNAINHFSICR
jgi:hypothetical protein